MRPREKGRRRVLELGSYIAPAYAGLILAEQGFEVEKWIVRGADPILHLHRGAELWAWINHGKRLVETHAGWVNCLKAGEVEIVIDNFRPSTLEKWGINPALIAAVAGVVWVSLRSEVGESSFDVVAQARAWGGIAPWVPFYIGDTAAGLWLAFKALAMTEPGHYPVYQATALAKLVEGELVLEADHSGPGIPWDPDLYQLVDGVASVEHRGVKFHEPVRDHAWRLANLKHRGGRLVI